MPRKSICVAGLGLVASLALSLSYAGQPTRRTATEIPGSASDLEKQLATLESAWARSTETRDAEKIDRLLDESYFMVDAKGRLTNREAYLADMKSGKLRVESWAIENSTTRPVGNTAVVSATVGIIGQYQQRDINGYFQITDTFVR
jgi:hypothetical protein